jgi:hypothetical protein
MQKYENEDLLKLALEVVQEAARNAKRNPTSDMIQIVIVEPFKKPYKKIIPNTLAAMRRIVGGHMENIFIGETGTGAKIGAVVNEEGKVINLPFNRRILGKYQQVDIFVGTFFITAYNMEGDNVSLTDAECERYIKGFTSTEVYL